MSEYRRRIAELLGARDPLVVLAETPGTLREISVARDAQRLAARPAAGTWSALEVIGHLVDAEIVFARRLRAVLYEQDPVLPGWDQEAWVDGQRYAQADPAVLVERFAVLRAMNLPLWSTLRPEDLDRAGRHTGRGRETLGEMRRIAAGHDLIHLRQIERALA